MCLSLGTGASETPQKGWSTVDFGDAAAAAAMSVCSSTALQRSASALVLAKRVDVDLLQLLQEHH